MRVVKEDEKGNYKSLITKEITLENLKELPQKNVEKILDILSTQPMYPKLLAKKLNVHEQKVYYYINKLEKVGFIEKLYQENINGTYANFYSLSNPSFTVRFKEFENTSIIKQKTNFFLSPFIEGEKLNSIIIVGSPDPHGPEKARSRDGYFGMDLALFLGSYLTGIESSKVRLDTEITERELKENNLIVIGGPIVNRVNYRLNPYLNIYYDENKKYFVSQVSNKTYVSEEIGIVDKIKNPYSEYDKEVLFVAGIRNAGTKAAILSFLKYFNDLEKGNIFNNKLPCRVVEGFDLDSDGKVDDIEFLE